MLQSNLIYLFSLTNSFQARKIVSFIEEALWTQHIPFQSMPFRSIVVVFFLFFQLRSMTYSNGLVIEAKQMWNLRVWFGDAKDVTLVQSTHRNSIGVFSSLSVCLLSLSAPVQCSNKCPEATATFQLLWYLNIFVWAPKWPSISAVSVTIHCKWKKRRRRKKINKLKPSIICNSHFHVYCSVGWFAWKLSCDRNWGSSQNDNDKSNNTREKKTTTLNWILYCTICACSVSMETSYYFNIIFCLCVLCSA